MAIYFRSRKPRPRKKPVLSHSLSSMRMIPAQLPARLLKRKHDGSGEDKPRPAPSQRVKITRLALPRLRPVMKPRVHQERMRITGSSLARGFEMLRPRPRDDDTPTPDTRGDPESDEQWRIGSELCTHISTDGTTAELVASSGERRPLDIPIADISMLDALRVCTVTLENAPTIDDIAGLWPFANTTTLRLSRMPLAHHWWRLNWKQYLPRAETLVLFVNVTGNRARSRFAISPIPNGFRRLVLNLCLWREDGTQFDAVPFEQIKLSGLTEAVAKDAARTLREVLVNFSFVPLGRRRKTVPGLVDRLFEAIHRARHISWQLVGLHDLMAEVGFDIYIKPEVEDTRVKRANVTYLPIEKAKAEPHPLDSFLTRPIPSLEGSDDPCIKLVRKDADFHLRITTRGEFATAAKPGQVTEETVGLYSEAYVAERVRGLCRDI